MEQDQKRETKNLFELTYCSTAADNLDRKHINQILKEAREFNGKHDITGCLLYHDGEFAQILEGQHDDVQSLYGRICNDERHYNVSLLAEGEKEDRYFDNWDMAYSELSDLEDKFNDRKYFEDNIVLLSEMILKPTRTARVFWSKVRLIMEKSRNSDSESPIYAFFLGSKPK